MESGLSRYLHANAHSSRLLPVFERDKQVSQWSSPGHEELTKQMASLKRQLFGLCIWGRGLV